MTLVAPRIVNDLPYVSTVNHDIHFEWQAPYLLRCVGDACSMYFLPVTYMRILSMRECALYYEIRFTKKYI